MPDRFTSIIDVHVILRRAGRILLLRRAGNVYASGQLCLTRVSAPVDPRIERFPSGARTSASNAQLGRGADTAAIPLIGWRTVFAASA